MEVSTREKELELISEYEHFDYDIRHTKKLKIFLKNLKVKLNVLFIVQHNLSHDWAKDNPLLDFEINAKSTLDLLIMFKRFCPEALFY